MPNNMSIHLSDFGSIIEDSFGPYRANFREFWSIHIYVRVMLIEGAPQILDVNGKCRGYIVRSLKERGNITINWNYRACSVYWIVESASCVCLYSLNAVAVGVGESVDDHLMRIWELLLWILHPITVGHVYEYRPCFGLLLCLDSLLSTLEPIQWQSLQWILRKEL